MTRTDLDIASIGIHADDELAQGLDVSAPIHVSTTFKYPSDPDELVPYLSKAHETPPPLVYSRLHQPNTLRAEKILGDILDGEAILYSSGLAAFHAAMVHFNPKNVFIGDGYHGCHGILNILKRNYGIKVHPLDADPNILQPGDIIHVESPVNPTALTIDVQKYADIAHSKGAHLLVDATFAPPPLFNPFEFGADMIMHSATKYFGGHSDLLAGVLVTKDVKIKSELYIDRLHLGGVIGSLEAFLLIRSLRSFKCRILQQSKNAEAVVRYFSENKAKYPIIKEILHHSFQNDRFSTKQMKGSSPVFSIRLTSDDSAMRLPSKLRLFHHATSLGGAESLIEWRHMSDEHVPLDLLRVSIGLEDSEDLIKDLEQGLQAVERQ